MLYIWHGHHELSLSITYVAADDQDYYYVLHVTVYIYFGIWIHMTYFSFFKRVQSYLDGEGVWLPVGFRQRVHGAPRIIRCFVRMFFLNIVSCIHLWHCIMVPMMYLWNHLGWIYDAHSLRIPYKLLYIYFPIRGIFIIYTPGKNKTTIRMRCAHNDTCISDIYCMLCATLLGCVSPSDLVWSKFHSRARSHMKLICLDNFQLLCGTPSHAYILSNQKYVARFPNAGCAS